MYDGPVSLSRGAAFAAAWVALSGAFAGRAQAQRTSSLSWVRLPGAESCISTQALAERVEQRLGRAAFVSASQADLSLEGHVERDAKKNAFVATLAVSDRKGQVLGRRVLRSPGEDCQALEPSLVLVVAIAIDPNATLPGMAGAEAALSPEVKAMLGQLGLPELSEQQLRDELAVPDPEAARAAAEAASAPQAKQARPGLQAPAAPSLAPVERSTPLRFRLALGLSGELGVLPQAGLGAALRLGVIPAHFWSFELFATGLLPQSLGLAGGAESARFRFVAGGLATCPLAFSPRGIELRACAGLRAGVLAGSGAGLTPSFSTSGPWLEAEGYGGIGIPLSSVFGLYAELGAGVPFVRDNFRYEDGLGQQRSVHRASAVTARAELGAGASF